MNHEDNQYNHPGANVCPVIHAQGAILIRCNSPTSAISQYTLSGELVNAMLVSNVDNVQYIAVSGTDLFVSYDATVGEYTISGGVVNASLISGIPAAGIAILGTNLFVSEGFKGIIGEYTISGATNNASLITGLNDPSGIAISGTNLFVANTGNGTIGEYTTSGATINTNLISGLSNPTSIAISGTNLFVENSGAFIGEYTVSGTPVNASLITGVNDEEFAIAGSDLFARELLSPGTVMDWRAWGRHARLFVPPSRIFPPSFQDRLAFVGGFPGTPSLAIVRLCLQYQGGRLLTRSAQHPCYGDAA